MMRCGAAFFHLNSRTEVLEHDPKPGDEGGKDEIANDDVNRYEDECRIIQPFSRQIGDAEHHEVGLQDSGADIRCLKDCGLCSGKY